MSVQDPIRHSEEQNASHLVSKRRRVGSPLFIERRLTSNLRLLPDFIIIGAQKCGTSSLYENLTTHPSIFPAFRKEVHFFDNNFDKGTGWYRAHFPLRLVSEYLRLVRRQDCRVCEASPYYIFHPLAPNRIRDVLPDAQLIALLRNPVERAYSHYLHEVRRGREHLSFEDAIDCEERRLSSQVERLNANPSLRSIDHRRYSYLSRGVYVDQLRNWTTVFRREQLLILRSEDLFVDSAAVLDQVVQWLGLRPFKARDFSVFNRAPHATPMNSATRERLVAYFELPNQRLYDYLRRDMNWS